LAGNQENSSEKIKEIYFSNITTVKMTLMIQSMKVTFILYDNGEDIEIFFADEMLFV